MLVTFELDDLVDYICKKIGQDRQVDVIWDLAMLTRPEVAPSPPATGHPMNDEEERAAERLREAIEKLVGKPCSPPPIHIDPFHPFTPWVSPIPTNPLPQDPLRWPHNFPTIICSSGEGTITLQMAQDEARRTE